MATRDTGGNAPASHRGERVCLPGGDGLSRALPGIQDWRNADLFCGSKMGKVEDVVQDPGRGRPARLAGVVAMPRFAEVGEKGEGQIVAGRVVGWSCSSPS